MHHPDEVVNVVASYKKVPARDLVSGSRRWQLVEARRVAAVTFRLLGFSSVETGLALGGRDHTTVLHSLKTAEEGDIADAEACLELLDTRTYSVRWAVCDDGVRWFIANPRSGVEIKLPIETGATMSLAMSLQGVDE